MSLGLRVCHSLPSLSFQGNGVSRSDPNGLKGPRLPRGKAAFRGPSWGVVGASVPKGDRLLLQPAWNTGKCPVTSQLLKPRGAQRLPSHSCPPSLSHHHHQGHWGHWGKEGGNRDALVAGLAEHKWVPAARLEKLGASSLFPPGQPA